MSGFSFVIATSWGDSGVSLHFRALAAELIERGHAVALLVDGQRRDVEDPYGAPAVWTWPSRRPVRPADAWFLWRLIRVRRPQCLVANFGATNVMMCVGWLTRVPCRVAWYHTLSSAIDADWRGSRLRKKALRARKALVYRLATHVVANSRAAQADLSATFGVSEAKSTVFTNSIADWGPPDPGTRLTERPYVLCPGRLHESKGQDVLIRALALLKASGVRAQVVFAGDGPMRSGCVALARELGVEDLCAFRGAVPWRELLTMMAEAAVTVVPSRSEAFGFVNIESMSSGTPVVASAVGGIPEIVRDGSDGFLVPPGDAATLAQKLRILLEDPTLRMTMGRSARQRFLDSFEQKRCVAAQSDWLEAVVGAAVRGGSCANRGPR